MTYKRPIILSLICIAGIIWSLVNFVFVFSPYIRRISELAPAIYGTIIALQFISLIGVWNMKRWGVELFIIVFFAKLIFAMWIDDINYIGIFFSVVFIALFLVFYPKMGEEL